MPLQRGCGLCGTLCLPSFPVTDFHHKASISTYSGGTVRDLHPIILFSCMGFSAQTATKWLFDCQKYCSTGENRCQPRKLRHSEQSDQGERSRRIYALSGALCILLVRRSLDSLRSLGMTHFRKFGITKKPPQRVASSIVIFEYCEDRASSRLLSQPDNPYWCPTRLPACGTVQRSDIAYRFQF